jgi:hypothetical protein
VQVCAVCHNDRLSSGGLKMAAYLDPATPASNRVGWERILKSVRAGEMPPPAAVRPVARIASMADFLQSEFERQDRERKPDAAALKKSRKSGPAPSSPNAEISAMRFPSRGDGWIPCSPDPHIQSPMHTGHYKPCLATPPATIRPQCITRCTPRRASSRYHSPGEGVRFNPGEGNVKRIAADPARAGAVTAALTAVVSSETSNAGAQRGRG